jgi:hypothetical protein
LTKKKSPHFVGQLQHFQYARQVDPNNPFASQSRSIASALAHIDGLFQSRSLAAKELCIVCRQYDWKVLEDGAGGMEVVEVQQYGEKPALRSSSLPSGSLFDLMNRPNCPICMLIIHLLSPFSIKSLLAWAMDQSLEALVHYQYSMDYQSGDSIAIRIKQRSDYVWRNVGFLEPTPKKMEAGSEQSIIWNSCRLSRHPVLNSSWAQEASLDYSLIRSWLKHCNVSHERCARKHTSTDIHTRIRLVDVVDHKIVHGTLADRYIALSYVWGSTERLRSTTANIAALEKKGELLNRYSSIPRTIQDAMTVVARLGERFLWVDSLCIVQDDRSEKHGQIAKMDLIYSAAYVTIVQHSGSDSSAGLPGIRPGSRSLIATKAHVEDFVMMACANHSVPGVLRSSIHSTRGWTLQEVLLSSRCLHFFDKHLTFVCAEEYAQDWISRQQDEKSGEIIRKRVLSPHLLWQMNPLSLAGAELPNLNPKIVEWLRHFETYARVLTDYTSRHLSYDSDILHAFHGLGVALGRLTGSARLHFGLPSSSFDFALLWVNFGEGGRRNDNRMPSWTWAAWAGPSTYNICRVTGDPSTPVVLNSFVKAFYMVENGTSVEVERRTTTSRNQEIAVKATPYFKERQRTLEPPFDLEHTRNWPEGCLHFWAEEASMDQFNIQISVDQIAFLNLQNPPTCCGILALPLALQAAVVSKDEDLSDYSLVLMSETSEPLQSSTFRKQPGLRKDPTRDEWHFPIEYSDGRRIRHVWYFNLLLVKKNGFFVERVAFGQIHMLSWLRAARRRRYIRII